MAAGGSAPELFTSVIGVFVSFDDVGIGTIVGSMSSTSSSSSECVRSSPRRDNHIYWYEALVLFGFYLAYVSFMKWNQTMERLVKKLIYKNKVTRGQEHRSTMPTNLLVKLYIVKFRLLIFPDDFYWLNSLNT
ncbi:hypothetical protein NQ317_007654 [Molorchus minor]|uniref:Sodium/calcium exchanger membrane region domain-containing protein n=1 Tax=Molorchus minor TaxID=1323400 RepID=A0ABQ9JR23_9CUCU|nr:hypothetical protein NQ317_007654 [Molorchus minor]